MQWVDPQMYTEASYGKIKNHEVFNYNNKTWDLFQRAASELKMLLHNIF